MELYYNMSSKETRQRRIEALEEELYLCDREIEIVRGRLLAQSDPENGKKYAKLLYKKKALGVEINELIKHDDIFGTY